MSNLRVLVVGASIAGPTTAYWLAKAGAKVTVIERFPQLRTGGQNVDIRSVGVAVMRKMPGMEAAVRAKAIPMDGITFVRSDGSTIGTLTPTGDPNQQSLVSEYEIYRGDLARVLYDLTSENENINYIFGEQVACLKQHDEEGNGPVTVDFANGLPSAEFDLVVACDGATSRTRAMALGCGVRDHIETTNGWAAFFTLPEPLTKGSNTVQSYSAPGGRFVGIGTDPSGASRAVLMGLHPSSAAGATLPFRQAADAGDDALRRFFAAHYRGAGWLCDDIADALPRCPSFYASELVRIKTPHLHRGRVALVGDAGYGSGASGVGTSLALAGAYILAGEVAARASDGNNIPASLRAYERRVRPIVDDLQQVSPLLFSAFAPQTSWGLRVRNVLLAFVLRSGLVGFVQKYLAGAFAGPEKHVLPEYAWPGMDGGVTDDGGVKEI